MRTIRHLSPLSPDPAAVRRGSPLPPDPPAAVPGKSPLPPDKDQEGRAQDELRGNGGGSAGGRVGHRRGRHWRVTRER